MKGDTKCEKWRWFVVVRGRSRSLESENSAIRQNTKLAINRPW